MPSPAFAPPGSQQEKIRGVNLGGWLVLEKWITPSLFQGLSASDETSYSVELGPGEAGRRLAKHRAKFITRDDFVWLKKAGVNVLRLPVGYWLYDDYPEHPALRGTRPFVPGGLDIVDQALSWAESCGLGLLLDLHTAPGCQNGFDNGGIQGVCDWPARPEYREYVLEVLERLAARYGKRPGLWGIEALNEPRWDIPTDFLRTFTEAAYERVRRHCPENVAFVFHDGFRSFREYAGLLQGADTKNVWLDIHRYQCFVPEETGMDIFGHLAHTAQALREEAEAICRESGFRAFCGEWSLGLDQKVVDLWAKGPFQNALEGMDEFQMAAAYRAYAGAQLLAFERLDGWFFWTFRTETTPAWSFRDCVDQRFIPHMGRDEELVAVRAETRLLREREMRG